MELLSLRTSHVRLFTEDGTVIIAIINSKTSKGLQQSLSLKEPGLVAVLSFLLDRACPSSLLHPYSAVSLPGQLCGLHPLDFLPYSLRRGGATEYYQRTQSLGRGP